MKTMNEYARELTNASTIASSYSKDVPESRSLVIGRRKASEEEVKGRVEKDLNNLGLLDWKEIVEVMNRNGFEKGRRFSAQFELNNYHNLIKKRCSSVTNAAVEHLLRGDIDVVERIREFQSTIGNKAPGLFSCILYVEEPGTFFPWIGKVNNRVNELKLVSPPIEMGRPEDYPRYCEAIREVMLSHRLAPQEMDYLFTTYMEL